jgi:hypothetical protein
VPFSRQFGALVRGAAIVAAMPRSQTQSRLSAHPSDAVMQTALDLPR